MKFKPLEGAREEELALSILAGIDRGETRIFRGEAPSFGGFIDRLFYAAGQTYGTYCASLDGEELHIQIGFDPDMPEGMESDMTALIKKSRAKANAKKACIWYPAANEILDRFIFTGLPWTAQVHKTYELTFKKNNPYEPSCLPETMSLLPFSEQYLDLTCAFLDTALSHTFNDPKASVFTRNKEHYAREWMEGTKECRVVFQGGEIVGAYALTSSEIDILAVAQRKQGQGLGRLLLHHARERIAATRDEEAFLYCMSTNLAAVQFYVRAGMTVTGYAGCADLTP